MEPRLPLLAAAIQSSARTILLQLRHVTLHCSPTLNLSLVVGTTAAEVVAAIPLKPAARIFVIDPTLPPPHDQRLRRVHAKTIQLWIMTFMTKFRVAKPFRRKFFPAVSHILAAEYSQLQHLFGRQLGFEIRMKVPARKLTEVIDIAALDEVVDGD